MNTIHLLRYINAEICDVEEGFDFRDLGLNEKERACKWAIKHDQEWANEVVPWGGSRYFVDDPQSYLDILRIKARSIGHEIFDVESIKISDLDKHNLFDKLMLDQWACYNEIVKAMVAYMEDIIAGEIDQNIDEYLR